LPNVVLFPGVVVPLHIFEPRYRRMVADALAGDRRLGMAVLKPGWESDQGRTPAVYPLVGYGTIDAAGKLPDGRYMLRLRGEGKGHIEAEVGAGPYRRAVVATRIDRPTGPALSYWIERIATLVAELDRLAGDASDGDEDDGGEAGAAGSEAQVSGIEFVHMVASELAIAPEAKLALLALDDPMERARRVAGLLDDLVFKRQAMEERRRPGVDPRLN
jgi:Lon protease-like protein